ncbi:MAG: hypothetical protein OXU42_00855 [Deltaproteobacteria bacterium]|nr:hypothetical protein [Deltaproteobacteria bacterium]
MATKSPFKNDDSSCHPLPERPSTPARKCRSRCRATLDSPFEEVCLMEAIGIVVSPAALGDRYLSSGGGQGTRHLTAVPVADDEDETFISISSPAVDAETG